MRKAIVLYNPLSGRRRERRTADVEAVLAVLRGAGVEVSASPTEADGEAGRQAEEAIASGCDAIFACGGGGTDHGVLQGMVGSAAGVGVISFGNGDSLAPGVRIPWDSASAARMGLGANPRLG